MTAPPARPTVVFLHRRGEPHLDEMQHVPVTDPARNGFQKRLMRDRVKVRG